MKADEFLDYIETEIIDDEKKIIEQRLVYEKTKESFESLLDKYWVFKKAKQLSANINFDIMDENKLDENIIDEDVGMPSNLSSISGIIKVEDEMRFKKMVFRVSRGRAIPTFFDLDEEEYALNNEKKIFYIFFQGGMENVLKLRLLKICDIFNCSR